MKIVAIEHERCNEYDKTEYYAAPDSMSEDEIQEAVRAAQTAYLADLEKVTVEVPLPDRVSFQVADHDDNATIGEIKARLKAYDEAVMARNKAIQARTSFTEELKKVGIVEFWTLKHPDLTKCFLSWGHFHTKKFEY